MVKPRTGVPVKARQLRRIMSSIIMCVIPNDVSSYELSSLNTGEGLKMH